MVRSPKRYLIILIGILYLASFASFAYNSPVTGVIQGREHVLFSDDFESYSVGSFPSQGGWEIVWSGAGSRYQMVLMIDHEHGKVLHLLGRTGCSSVVKRSFTTNSRYIGYEFDILIQDRGEGYRDHPGFFCEGCRTWGVYWATVEFSHKDGKIYAKDGTVLGSWTPGRWYHVKVILDRETDRYDVYIDGQLKGHDLQARGSDDPSSWNIKSLALVSGWPAEHVFYDNVKVFIVEDGTTNGEENLEVDVYTNKGGRGANARDGEYHVGETVGIYCSVNTPVDRLKLILFKPSSQEALVLYDDAWSGGTLRKYGTAGYPLGTRIVACVVWKNGVRRSDVTTYNVVEAETKEDAEIIDFDPPRGTYSPGDTLSASVIIKNTGNVERSFWVGLSYRKPDGSYYDIPPRRTQTLSPNEEQRLTFHFVLPSDAPAGSYDAIAAVWNGYDSQRNEMIPPQFDRKEVENAFTVTSKASVQVQLIQPQDGAVIRELPVTFIVRVLVNGEPARGIRVGLTCMDGGTSYCHPIDGVRFRYTDSNGYVRFQGFGSLAPGSSVRWYAEALYQGRTYRSEIWRFTYQPLERGDQYEPDDSMQQAKEIKPGEEQRRSISPPGDVDWVKFILTEPSTVVIETSGPSGDTVLYLYDSSGNRIAYDDDGGPNYWSRIEKDLDPGIYYVKVTEYGENDKISEYFLKLTITTSNNTSIRQLIRLYQLEPHRVSDRKVMIEVLAWDTKLGKYVNPNDLVPMRDYLIVIYLTPVGFEDLHNFDPDYPSSIILEYGDETGMIGSYKMYTILKRDGNWIEVTPDKEVRDRLKLFFIFAGFTPAGPLATYFDIFSWILSFYYKPIYEEYYRMVKTFDNNENDYLVIPVLNYNGKAPLRYRIEVSFKSSGNNDVRINLNVAFRERAHLIGSETYYYVGPALELHVRTHSTS